jgi:hypothetical protein
MAKGLKSFPTTHFVNDCVFSWIAIIGKCIVVDDANYTIYGQVRSIITTSIKV